MGSLGESQSGVSVTVSSGGVDVKVNFSGAGATASTPAASGAAAAPAAPAAPAPAAPQKVYTPEEVAKHNKGLFFQSAFS